MYMLSVRFLEEQIRLQDVNTLFSLTQSRLSTSAWSGCPSSDIGMITQYRNQFFEELQCVPLDCNTAVFVQLKVTVLEMQHYLEPQLDARRTPSEHVQDKYNTVETQ